MNTDNWHGKCVKKWIPEKKIQETTREDCIEHPETLHTTDPLTKQEFDNLQQSRKSAVFAHENDKKVLREYKILEEKPLYQFQVFIEQYADGRKNAQQHYVEGTTKTEGLSNLTVDSTSTITHIGSIAEYLETASELSFNLNSSVIVPHELMGYNAKLSEAYRKVTGDNE